ncbi:MAG: sulfatase [Bacteroidales bacterium]|nr:sulfatase [Bacteroidales bacterium]
MNKTIRIILAVALLSAVCAIYFYGQHKKNKQRPNIIFIMSDDHAEQAISAYGYGLNETPHIDRLANEGAIFKNSFVANSICAPSRAVMLTGKFSHVNGQLNNTQKFDGSQLTYPKLLQQAGYQTALVGKWHLKSDPTGFDFWSVHYGQGDYYNPDFKEMGKRKRYEGYSTNIVRENGIDWLEKRDKDKPFALLMHFKAPHRNWMPEISKLNMYEDREFPIPATYWDEYENRGSAAAEQEMSIIKDMKVEWDLKMFDEGPQDVSAGNYKKKLDRMNPDERQKWDEFYNQLRNEYRQKAPEGKELAKWKFQRYMRDYLKVVSSVDDNIGKVLDYLDDNDLAENTIVVYTSDQGFYLGEHGWFDKRFMYEQSLRTPLLVRYPKKIEAGTEIKGMVQNIDYAPTFLDYAELPAHKDMQGLSLKPLLDGKKTDIRDAIYYQYFEYPGPHAVKRHYGIRTKRHKLIHFYNDVDEWELYDLENDPMEMNNLYNDVAYQNLVDDIKQQLMNLKKTYNDTVSN